MTVTGSAFNQSSVVRVGDTACKTTSLTPSQIICVTKSGPIGTFSVTVQTGDSVSVPSDAARFQYVLSVSSVTPTTLGFRGGVPAKFTGEGFAAGDASVLAQVETYSRETYVIGLYTSPLVRETQDISFLGTLRKEVQRIAILSSIDGDFSLSGWGASTRNLPRNVNSYELQDAINAIVPAGASVQVSSVTAAQSSVVWDVEFCCVLGDIRSESSR